VTQVSVENTSTNEAYVVDGTPTPAEIVNDHPASTDTSFLNITVSEAPKPIDPEEDAKQKANLAIREGKFSAMEARKRTLEGEIKGNEETKSAEGTDPKSSKESKVLTVKDSKGRLVKVLDDDEEELDCEFLNNRQSFLNLCQGNHYQFDAIRRAKHSSMMVLWHLHNRDAPKFVQQCATCSREILSGYRLHCPTCADFDQCQDCYQNPKIARHPHQLKPIAIASTQQNELTEAQRKERQRSIQLHMTLLLHAATCTSSDCPSANCTKMKGLLKHGSQCQVKAVGGCNVCKRIWALLQIHARQCKTKVCRVPNCMAIRERVRQLKQQQQAMDDRRRQEMNRAYRGKR
jgi:E1A/CREB-binding protein